MPNQDNTLPILTKLYPPSLRITVPPLRFFRKGGVQFRLAALSFFRLFLGFRPRHDKRKKSPSYSLNMKGLSFFWRLLS